jgi:hypothetical protein
MATRFRALLVIAVVLSLLALCGCGPRRVVLRPDEVLYGTWTNPSPKIGCPNIQKVVVSPGRWEDYYKISDQDPCATGTLEVTAKWKGEDGSTWYRTRTTVMTGQMKGAFYQTLERIDPTGETRETGINYLMKFDDEQYPKDVRMGASWASSVYRRKTD